MKYLAKLRPHPDGQLCRLIYRSVRSCLLPLRHMFHAPVLFSSRLALPTGGSWWYMVAMLQLWLGVFGAPASQGCGLVAPQGLVDKFTTWEGSYRPSGKCCSCRSTLGSPSLEVMFSSHSFVPWTLTTPVFFTQSLLCIQTGDTRRTWRQRFPSKTVKTADCSYCCCNFRLELSNKL